MTWFAPNLPPNKHCFFGSDGGFSQGFYSGLNVNTKSDDDPNHIHTNLQHISQYFGLNKEALNLLNQGVSANVAYISKASWDNVWADGSVTDQKDVILCIRTADCAPILLADYQHGVIGAAHAGWRGAIGGVIQNTIKLMLQKGAVSSNISAAVGPCIAQKSYEVDDDFYKQFISANPQNKQFFISGSPQHYFFNLEAYCVDILKSCQIKDISYSQQDTYALRDKYYSFRRFSHQGLICKPKCFPTELSAITL